MSEYYIVKYWYKNGLDLPVICVTPDERVRIKMNKSNMLILGTGGIAKACVEKFNSTYQITSVSRRTGDIKGDLTEVSFRDHLVETTQPKVIIAAYGDWPENMSLSQALNMHFNSVVDLFEKFESKGGLEYFVVISSIDAICSSHPFMPLSQFAYRVAKKSLSVFFKEVQLFGRYNSKVVLIEPGFVATNFCNINRRMIDKNSEDIIFKLKLDVYKTEAVAKQIFDCLNSSHSSLVTMHNKSNNWL